MIQTNNKIERKLLICDCGNVEHQILIWYDNEEKTLYIEPHLITHRNFFTRFLVGIKYAFGYKSKYGEFDEVFLDYESQLDLLNFLKEKIKTIK